MCVINIYAFLCTTLEISNIYESNITSLNHDYVLLSNVLFENISPKEGCKAHNYCTWKDFIQSNCSQTSINAIASCYLWDLGDLVSSLGPPHLFIDLLTSKPFTRTYIYLYQPDPRQNKGYFTLLFCRNLRWHLRGFLRGGGGVNGEKLKCG